MSEVKENIEVIEQTKSEITPSDLKALSVVTGDSEQTILENLKLQVKGNEQVEVVVVEETPKTEEPKTEKKTVIKSENPFLQDLETEETTENKTDIKVETLEDAFSLLKSDLGLEITTPEQFKEFTQKYKEHQELTKDFDTIKSERDNALKIFEEIPDEIYGLIQSYYKGEDYQAEMAKLVEDTKVPFDHKLPFEKQDIKTVMDYLYPQKFTEDDYEDMEDNSAMKFVLERAKTDYEALQTKLNTPKKTNYREQSQEQLNKQKELFKSSIKSSVEEFSKTSKYFKPEQIKEIEAEMQGGQNYILSTFMNNDGTFKKNAPKLIALLKYGENAIEEMKAFALKRGETKANEEILKREVINKPKQKEIPPQTAFEKMIQEDLKQKQNFRF